MSKITTFVQITGSIVGCHKKVTIHLPITIGSYPFQESTASQAISSFSYPNLEMQSDTCTGLSSTLTTQQQQQLISTPQVPLSTNQNANFMHPTIPCGCCDCHLNGCKFLCGMFHIFTQFHCKFYFHFRFTNLWASSCNSIKLIISSIITD